MGSQSPHPNVAKSATLGRRNAAAPISDSTDPPTYGIIRNATLPDNVPSGVVA
jgi:hypothetical protein